MVKRAIDKRKYYTWEGRMIFKKREQTKPKLLNYLIKRIRNEHLHPR